MQATTRSLAHAHLRDREDVANRGHDGAAAATAGRTAAGPGHISRAARGLREGEDINPPVRYEGVNNRPCAISSPRLRGHAYGRVRAARRPGRHLSAAVLRSLLRATHDGALLTRA